MPFENAADTEHGRFAIHFAEALVRGDFDAAADMLEDSLRRNNPPHELRRQYEEMVGLFECPAILGLGSNIAPGEREDEAGWVYCSIEGDNSSEAVTVLVVTQGNKHAIRQIVWFRP